jgi:hypothetical protein
MTVIRSDRRDLNPNPVSRQTEARRPAIRTSSFMLFMGKLCVNQNSLLRHLFFLPAIIAQNRENLLLNYISGLL